MTDQAVVLLIDDLEDDLLLIRRAFEKAGLSNPLHCVRSGQEAIEYLTGAGRYADRAEYPLPDLILLDLKMPAMDGFEVLTWIRKQPGIRTIAVVVLTSSELIKDVNRAYALGANSFLTKPLDFENYTELSKVINEYWVARVKTPDSFRPPPKPNGHKSKS